MATFDVNTQVRKVTTTATGQTEFDFSFQVNSINDIDVYVDSVLQTSHARRQRETANHAHT